MAASKTATNKVPAAPAPAETAKTTERAPRKRAGVDFDPAEVFNYATSHQPCSVADVATKFDLSPIQVKSVILDFAALNQKIPPQFQQRSLQGGSGIATVSEIKIKQKTKDGVELKDKQGNVITKSAGLKLNIGNATLREVNAAVGDHFSVTVDAKNRTITLAPYTAPTAD